MGVSNAWAATQRYIYVGISNEYQNNKDGNNFGLNVWGGTSEGVKSLTWIQDSYNWDGRNYTIYRAQVYDDNNKAQFKGNNNWWDPGDGFSVELNGTTNNAIFFSHNNDGWQGQFQQNYQVTSNASLEANKTNVLVGENVTLTPSLSSNATYNQIKSTTYTVSTNPNSGGKVTSGVFSATKAGTYTVTATVTYNPKYFTGITKTATATQTIKVYDTQYVLRGSQTANGDPTGGMAGWDATNNNAYTSATINGTTMTIVANLTNAKTQYKFKIYNNFDGSYYGQTGSAEITNNTSWTLNGSNDVLFTTTAAGSYTFIYNTSNKSIKVQYPTAYTVTYSRVPTAAANAPTTSPSISSGAYVLANTSVTFTAKAANTGYTWKGWYSNNAGSGTALSANQAYTTSITANTTIYAVYTANTYTVKFDKNGGTGTMSDQNFTYGTSQNLTANTFTRTGYTFAGWATSANGNKVYNDKQSVNNLSSTNGATVTLYAKWTANTYTVKFNANGGSGTMNNQSFTYDEEPKALTTNAFTRTGYTFAGWNTKADGTGTKFIDGQKVQNLTANNNSTYNIYAQWTINQYTLTYSAGEGGSVTATAGGKPITSPATINHGTSVTLEATPSGENAFAQWVDGSGVKVSTANPYTFTLTSNKTLKAEFSKPTTVYLKPSHSWKSNNAQFAVKYGGTNHMMIEVEECCEEKYYKVTIPSQYSKFNFVRLSGNSTTEWNVTGEISVPTDGKNLYDMTKIYLKPNGNWKSGNARFAAYFFDSQDNLNKNKWMSMLPTDEDGIFYCDFPTDHIFDRVSLTRMNGAESYNDWANRWNQTQDIDLFQGYNSYELEEGKWGKDNSNPQNDDGMNVIYKCKWTTYNPTYSVTLEPTPYGHYTVEYNGRTYKSATDKNVVIEDVALGATIRVSKGTPDNSAEYTDDLVLQKASGSGKTELKGGEYYDHTICGTTTITENFVTKNPHTVYLRVPTTVAKWYEEGYATPGANCVYYTHILDGGINLMEDVTGTIKGEDGYNYYQYTIPAGYRTFCFQYKSGTTPESYTPRNYTANFTHALPFINGLNCFTILGSDDDDYYYGEWGTLLQDNDYRLLYIEQKVELENGHPKTIVTKAHPSDIIKYNDTRTIYSLHIYNEVENGENGMNDPEILVQQWNGYNWITKERHMVFGPLHTDFDKAAMPGRRDADGETDAVLRYDNGIENIKNDINNQDTRFKDYNGSGVWNFVVTRNNGEYTGLDLRNTARYEGTYYVRTDCAAGGWNNYTVTDNHMTYSEVSKGHSNYSHYFCKWVGEAGVNVKYTIANDYSCALSDSLEADVTDIWGTELTDGKMVTEQTLPAKANVRFSWNDKTNFLHRAYLAGSTHAGNRFLIVKGENNNIFNADGNALTNHEKIFADISNWVYYADVKLVPNANLKVTADYNGKVQYFVGQENNYNNTILKGSGTNKYLIRLLYDFKTNHLLSAYVPGGNTTIEAIETDLMLIRKGNNDATQLTFNTKSMNEEGKTAYGVIEFPYELLTGSGDIYQRSLYWISFPFDVNLQDAFGVGQYGVHWLIQEYDGARRAEEGLWAESDSFWKLHWDQNITLKAGFGYVIELDIAKICSDYLETFKKSGDCVALYFPSAQPISSDIVKYPNNVSVEIPAHPCTIPIRDTPYGNRRIRDSHWNVIGVPSYVNAGADFSHSVDTRPEDRKLKFYYKWITYDNYVVADANNDNTYNDNFKSMFAYMVQYAGDLTWKSIVNDNTPQGLAARQNSDTQKEHNLRLELQQNGAELDRTFITLQEDDVTAAFDFNYDLCKVNNGGANIYSLIATDTYPIQVAGNVLPVENNVIPVGVIIRTAGEYTFAMPEGTNGIVVELIDYQANTTTNLLFNDYTVSLPKGTFDNRFALSVKPDKTATSVENISNEVTGDKAKKYIIDGVLYMQKDGVLYDAQGHIVR